MSENKNVRIAPNSKESEMMVLGCMLTSVNSLNIAADMLSDTDFYYTEHQIIFSVLQTLYKGDKPADVHLVCEELRRRDKLSAVGGPAYVTTLAQYAGTSAYIEEYTQLVKDKAILRRMISASQVVEKNALNEPDDVHECLDEAQKLFYEISQSANPLGGMLLSDIFSGVKADSGQPYLKELQERQERFLELGPEAAHVVGLETHYRDLDKMLNGLNKSNLIILAARPAMGKTAFAMNIAENVCFRNAMPVGIFSLEMSAEQLVHRIVCSQSEVESEKIKTGSLTGIEYQRIVSAVNQMQSQIMVIDDQPGLKVTDLRARARRMKETYNIQLLIVDYLQLLSGSGSFRNQENRQSEISEISRMLKNLARELDIPVICLSQLSRKVEERQGHRPMISDLRESGCLASDTKITNAETGEIYTIKELAERDVQSPIPIHAIEKDLKVGIHQMTKVFYSGRKMVYRLKTKTGRTIKASANHPFFTFAGWKRLDELKINEKIALPRQSLGENFQSTFSENELTLLAHLIGDGCIIPKQPYHYTSADPENINHVQNAAWNLFKIEGKIVNQKNWMHLYLPSPYRLTKGKYHPITNWYAEMGIEPVRSYLKVLPKSIFTCTKEQLCHFLHHLWATDGNISSHYSKKGSKQCSIYYGTSSAVLGEQVQHLLLKTGIQSTLRVIPSAKGYRNMYHVDISGAPTQIKFLKEINSAGLRGKNAPLLIENLEALKANTNVDVIPKEAWKTVVNEARVKAGLGWREVAAGLGMSYCGSTLFKSGISRARMIRLNHILNDKKLTDLASSDIYWDEISSIESLEEMDVYDATVPGVHNFLANDIFVHNSIEQDADIVLLMFRPEYYDANNKPGMAEVIVAKNRHGAVGTVNLVYRKEIAQFANYSPLRPQGIEVKLDPEAEREFSHFS